MDFAKKKRNLYEEDIDLAIYAREAYADDDDFDDLDLDYYIRDLKERESELEERDFELEERDAKYSDAHAAGVAMFMATRLKEEEKKDDGGRKGLVTDIKKMLGKDKPKNRKPLRHRRPGDRDAP